MKRKLAIVERLPGHTEIMGAFASLALELGYETHLLFNRTDHFHMVDYLQKRLSIAPDQVHDWSYVSDAASNFDVIVLNSSIVWLDYGWYLQQWSTTKRLIALHHHPEDIEMNPHGASVYLTPAGGEDKWIFPVYSRVPVVSASTLRQPAELPTLTIVGSLQGKDAAAVLDFLQRGGKVVHYDRHRCDLFLAYDGLYTHHRGLNGTQLVDAISALPRPFFLWLPVVPASTYTSCRFTGALTFGVDMDCVMVMPERLRNLYGFPENGVITYQSRVTEPDCLASLRAPVAQQSERRRALAAWATDRWDKNLAVMQTLLHHPAL